MKTDAPPTEPQEIEPPRPRSRSIAVEAVLIPLLALFSALVVGAIVMIFTNPEVARAWASFGRNPGNAISMSWDLVSSAYEALFEGAFGNPTAISETLLSSTPLILAGLSVALAFRSGLFNIGAEGQIIGVLDRSEATRERCGMLMAGLSGEGVVRQSATETSAVAEDERPPPPASSAEEETTS